MNPPRIIPIVKFFTLLTFVTSTIFIVLIYFSPAERIVNYSVVYGLLFSISTIILFIIIAIYTALQKKIVRKLLIAFLWLTTNSVIAAIYFMIWNYTSETILIKIVNHTGYEVTNAGIYGCFSQNWGPLADGESKTVRFPADAACAFAVTYQLLGDVKLELLPRKDFIKNIYNLGTNADIEIEK